MQAAVHCRSCMIPVDLVLASDASTLCSRQSDQLVKRLRASDRGTGRGVCRVNVTVTPVKLHGAPDTTERDDTLTC
jgi:hypothetical protein